MNRMAPSIRVRPGLTVLLLGTAGIAAAAPAVLEAHGDTPRAFGYSVGDVVTRRITLSVPDGLHLVPDSLPRAGAAGKALELQRVALHTSLFGVPEVLELDYQVFVSPRETKLLELPPVELRFDGAPRAQTVRVDAWPITVAPLVPAEPSPREGLGDLRPDRAPPLLDTSASRTRLIAEAGLLLLALGYLAHVYWVMPWSARRHRPFGRAWSLLKALPARADATQRRAAFERLHAALNGTAGEVLFAPGLDTFLARWPRYAPLRADLARFFADSREEFFGHGADATDTRWLVDLGRRLRDLERGAA